MRRATTRDFYTRDLKRIKDEDQRQENLSSQEYLLDQAIAAAKERNIDDALFFIDRLVELDSSDVRPLIIRAKLYLSERRYDDAKADIEYLIWLEPETKNEEILELKAVLDERLHYENFLSQFRIYG